MLFKLSSNLKPKGDQPKAIEELVEGVKEGRRFQTLLGVTGSGKTFTMAHVIARLSLPTLVISPNKTLAAQLYQEFKDLFPENAVHYFVSYYDYYQPEAYLPHLDLYIEKDAKINETIDKLRHAAVQDLLSRQDVIVVASVSCIYNLGSPTSYERAKLFLHTGEEISRSRLFSLLVSLQYERNDIEFRPGIFRSRGEKVEIVPATGEGIIELEFFGDTIEKIFITEEYGKERRETESVVIFPAKFWITFPDTLPLALANIRAELAQRLKELKGAGKTVEAERLQKRTLYDLELLEQTGYCPGIENYSRHLEFREPGSPPFTLLDYFPKPFLVFIDESHLTVPQLKAMAIQDRERKKSLVEYGFRLPSCFDNRPLTLEEFEKKIDYVIYVSATPGEYEVKKSKGRVVEQIVRPTGLLEPEIEIRSPDNVIEDLLTEIRERISKKQRVLVLTLTKRLAEMIAERLKTEGIRAVWLHSEVKTLKRPKILQQLREGEFDVLVGINLLREGLDLPEVSLVAILDADKEGFLRSPTTLIQIMGRAARHPEGKAILYASHVTRSMQEAISEVERRRKIQEEYNKKHGIKTQPISKPIRDWEFFREKKEAVKIELGEIEDVKILEEELKKAILNWDFERAIYLRDLLKQKGKLPKRLSL